MHLDDLNLISVKALTSASADFREEDGAKGSTLIFILLFAI